MALPTTVRKIIATALLVVFVPLYALFIMARHQDQVRDGAVRYGVKVQFGLLYYG